MRFFKRYWYAILLVLLVLVFVVLNYLSENIQTIFNPHHLQDCNPSWPNGQTIPPPCFDGIVVVLKILTYEYFVGSFFVACLIAGIVVFLMRKLKKQKAK